MGHNYISNMIKFNSNNNKISTRNVCMKAQRDAKWLPGTIAPSHLDGKIVGDFGFDPLGLGSNPERLKWYVEAEKTHGRWAMAAAAGIIGQEALGLGKWFEAAKEEYTFNLLPLISIQFLIMGFLEIKRFQGFKITGKSGFLNDFPFDPANMDSPDMQLKEIKNGRLAMIAFVGFAVQAIVTRAGPLSDLSNHIADPFGNNILSSVSNMTKIMGSKI